MIGGSIISPETSFAVMNATKDQAAQSAKTLKDAKELEKIDHAAREFESVFIAEMLKPMFENTTPSAPFNGGKGEEIFQGMMLQEYGKMIANNGGVGLTTQIRQQMIDMQEQANNATRTE